MYIHMQSSYLVVRRKSKRGIFNANPKRASSIYMSKATSIPPFTFSRQSPHHALKSHQRHRIRRKRPQKARQESPPVSPPPRLAIHRHSRIPPPAKPLLAIAQPATKRIRHDALLDKIARVARQPKHLRAQAARPEVDGRVAQARVLAQGPRQHVVAAPPEEEEAAEEQRGGQAVVDAAHAVVGVDLAHAVEGARIQALGLARGVLDLQAGLDVLHGRGDEADGRASHDARDAVSDRGQIRRL